MRITLAISPYFTNGDTPPMGMAYLNAALSQAGHDVRAYDLIFFTHRNYAPYFWHFRKFVNIGEVGRCVPFFLNIEFTLYALYHAIEHKHPWLKSMTRTQKAAFAAGEMMVLELVKKWSEMLLETDPELILLSTYTSNLFSTLPLAQELKRQTSAPVVIGGPGVGLPEIYEWVVSAGLADAVAVGEGEMIAVELAKGLEGGSLPENLPGLANPSLNRPRDFINDLDELPPPLYKGLPGPGAALKDYETLAENPYKNPFFEGLPVMASRGCTNRCAFCSEAVYWRKWRRRQPEKLAQEIASIADQTGRNVFLFCDSALNLDREWLTSFCNSIKPLKARFLSYLVAHKDMNEDLALKMRQAGWAGAVVGVETLSDPLRKRMRKRMSRAETMNTIRSLARADIWVKANILCGFPTETEDDVDSTITAMEKLNAEPDVKRRLWWDAGHPVRLEPYSDMYNHPDRYGIRVEPYKIEMPSTLADQQPFIDRLTMKWDPGFSPETVAERSRRIIAVAKNPD